MLILLAVIRNFYICLLHILNGENGGWNSLDDLIEQVQKAAMEAARGAVEAIVSILNDGVFRSPEIRRDGWRRKHRTQKMLHTSIGDICLQKDTYQHQDTHKCVPILFESLGITAHQRTSHELMYRVVHNSVFMSFRKAINAAGAAICPQTAINWLRNKVPVLERAIRNGVRAAEVLHVYLDEDHLSALRDPKRARMCLPVGAVSEGHEKECSGRYRLINPYYFASSDMTSHSLVDAIRGYICASYDLSRLRKIYVHGDGARWIGEALTDLGCVEYAMDGFHFERELRRCCRRFGKKARSIRTKLEKAIKADDLSGVQTILSEQAAAEDETVQEKTAAFGKYLTTYWNAIRSRLTSCPIGSCTEALVQHIASERFSSTPHGWSVRTVTRLAALRVFVMNGGSILTPENAQPGGTYAHYIEDYIARLVTEQYDFSLFDSVAFPMDGDSGTQQLMRLIGKGGQLTVGQ